MNPASNLFLVGPMGAGKTSIGRRLAQHFALEFIDLDEDIEHRTGASVTWIFDVEGEAGFREREQQSLRALCDRQGIVLATGGGAVLRASNRELLRAHGFVIYLQVSVDQQLRRLARDTKRPLLRATDRRERLQTLAREREPLYREVADLTMPGSEQHVSIVATRLAAEVERYWQRPDQAGSAA